jgi:hypothetical protein
MCIINALYTWYIKAVTDAKPWRAATVGEAIFVLNAFTVINYVHHPILILAATLGGFVGTFITVKFIK